MSKPPDAVIVDPSKQSSSRRAKPQPVASQAYATSLVDTMGQANTIQLERSMSFSTPTDEAIELSPGAYQVQAGADGHLVLTAADTGNGYSLAASTTWHELGLVSPFALKVPGEKEEQHVMILLPGGGALHTIGWSRSPGTATRPLSFPTTAGIVEAVLKWLPPSLVSALPFDRGILLNPLRMIWGSIQPGSSPTGFGPSSIPPNWISATVATCYVPPAGSAWPAPSGTGSYPPGSHVGPPSGAGMESGYVPFPPGSAVRRGAFPSYIQSVTPVTVTSSVSMMGRAVQLHVTSHVVTIGIPTILSMTWTDVYQIVPQADGPVTFPGVIVATGRVPTTPPAPTTSWPAEVQKRLTSPTGRGAPTVFELRLDGITVTTRTCEFLGRFPGSPEVRCQ
jgi:hypothetical protein